MRYLFVSIFVALVFASVSIAASPDEVLRAIAEQETGSVHRPDRLHNRDPGNPRLFVRGRYQISYAYWKDSGVRGRWEQVHDPRYAERVILAYWQKYGRNALRRGDTLTLAALHNGGPAGPTNANAQRYAREVQKRVIRLERAKDSR